MPEPMSDPIERVGDARDGLDRAAQRFERAAARRVGTSAMDASRQVTVRTTPDGTVEDILIATAWSRSLSPEELGAAVTEAYTAAGLAALDQWGTALADEVDGPEPATRPLAPTSDSLAFQLGQIVTPETLAERSESSREAMADLLRAALREVDEVSARAQAQAHRTLVGTARGASVTVAGTGTLVAVDVEPAWATRTPASGLSQYLMSAYKDALRQARVDSVTDVVAASSLGELQRLAEDPQALAARLGLT